MSDSLIDIKSMAVYRSVDRILNDLRALGIDDGAPLSPAELRAMDQYHYLGIEAVEVAADALALGEADRVLDIGSGLGGPARVLAERCGSHVTALELQADLNALAEDLTARCGLADKVSHLCGDMLSGVMDGQAFDGAISFFAIMHIPDRARLYDCCRAALKPGAAVYIEDIYAAKDLSEWAQADLAEKVYTPYLPSLETYCQQLTAAGFGDQTVVDMTEAWTDYVADRSAKFQADRERQLEIHGAEIVDGLDDFYQTMATLFGEGEVGGARILARLD